MMGWDCAECGKEIQDTRHQREQRLGARFVQGECSLCIGCANLAYDRDTKRMRPVEIDIAELNQLIKRKP
jgi:hypothetical protein